MRAYACPQCREMIALDAVRCRHCHHQLTDRELAEQARRRSTSNRTAAAIATLAAVLFVGDRVMLATGLKDPPPAPVAQPAPAAVSPSPAVRRETDVMWIKMQSEAVVRRMMKDPDGAHFRDVRYHVGPKGAHMVCGEVNGLNSFGARAGYQRFGVMNGVAFVADAGKLSAEMVVEICG